MMKLFASYILRGRLEAILTASTLAVLSILFKPLSFVSSATIALVTLRLGAKEGVIILAISILVAGIISSFMSIDYLFISMYVAILWLPVWIIAVVLREGRHITLAIEIAVLLGVIAVMGYYLFNDNPAQMWQQVLPRMVPPNAPVELAKQKITEMSPYMTGIASAGGVYAMLFGLFLGRWWQSLLYNPGGFKMEFLSLKTQPRLAFIALAIVFIAMISSGKTSEIAWNTAIILFVLYTFIGIAVLHTMFAGWSVGKLAVPMFYITLFFMVPYSVLTVALVGFSDTWLDLRNRKFNKS